MEELVVLGLGSNKSFEQSNKSVLSGIQIFEHVLRELEEFISDLKVSSVWKSAPMYFENQDYFYNMVVCGYYDGTPQKLLKKINAVEARWGRDRKKEFHNGPRTLDIDIELYGRRIVKTKSLTIPHERITERAFVLFPLLEILPDSADIKTGESFAAIAKRLSDQNVVRFGEVEYGRRNIDINSR